MSKFKYFGQETFDFVDKSSVVLRLGERWVACEVKPFWGEDRAIKCVCGHLHWKVGRAIKCGQKLFK